MSRPNPYCNPFAPETNRPYRTPLTAQEKDLLSRVTDREYHRIEYKDADGHRHSVSDGTYTLYPSAWCKQMLDRNASRNGLTPGERATLQKYLDNPPPPPTLENWRQLAELWPPTSQHASTVHAYFMHAQRMLDDIHHNAPDIYPEASAELWQQHAQARQRREANKLAA